jgi:aspartate racemase
VALLASNTPHLVFKALAERSPIPLLSIVEATCAQAKGLQRVGLFGTRFTMEGAFYPEVFTREGITLVTPEPEERATIHQVYMGELVLGVYRPETRERLLAIARRLQRECGIEALILGGTELPLILTEPVYEGLRMLDTTAIHVECAVQAMLAGAESSSLRHPTNAPAVAKEHP